VVSVKVIPGAMELSRDPLLEVYYKLLLSRTVAQRERMLNRLGKGPFAITGEGQEGTQVGAAYALRPGHDWVLPYYRDIGIAITIGQTPRDLLLALLSKAEDVSSGGRNMPSHFSDPKLHIVSGSAPVSTQLPHAVGVAFAAKLHGSDEVALVTTGDGGTSPGDAHEAMNFAGIHKCALVFLVEHNQYAISVPWSKQSAVANVSVRAQGYGFPGVTVDGNDVLAVYGAARKAVDRARRGEGPTLIEAKTYRMVPHSSDDDDRRYRTREEVDEWGKKDPLARYQKWLTEHDLMDQRTLEEVQQRVAQEVDEATEYAENAPKPAPESAVERVYAD